MEAENSRRGVELTRREFMEAATAISGAAAGATLLEAQTAPLQATSQRCALTINGIKHQLTIDPRVTLLDLFREQLHLTGTKKGCDHGQCGACTVLVNGERRLSCLTLAVTEDGQRITTIEGMASASGLHPMQEAFLEYDGFQCGFCTPGQICSAIGMLTEVRAGAPSAATKNLSQAGKIELMDDEIRERMSGNICRCGAYPNIVAAVRAVHLQG